MSFEALNMAASLLRSSRISLDVAARNLAGANEAGYTRQSLITVEQVPTPSPHNAQPVDGLGVQIVGAQRTRSDLADQVYRARSQDQATLEVVQPYLQDLETQLSGPQNLSQRYSAAAQALQSVQSHADDLGVRQNALQTLGDLAGSFQQTSQRLDSLEQDATADLQSRVDRTNQLLTQLADLNPRVVAAAGGTMGRNAQLDERDRLLDELGDLGNFQVSLQANGAVNVYQSGAELVFGDHATSIQLQADHSLVSATGRPLDMQGGALAGLQGLLSQELPDYRAQVDTLAQQVIAQANAVHQVGYGMDGGTGRALFTGSNAGNIQLAISDPRQLAGAVARMEGARLGTGVTSAASLSSQASQLTTPAQASGILQVNGQNIAWNDGQSLDQLATSLAAAGVDLHFDSQSQRVLLARNPAVPGPSSITVSDVSGNLAAALGLSGASVAPGGSLDNGGLLALSKQLESRQFGQPPDRGFAQAARGMATTLGQQVASRASDLQAAQDGKQAALTARQSISGVSTDEELLAIQRQQQAYAAAARVASVADEMLTTLIQQMGR